MEKRLSSRSLRTVPTSVISIRSATYDLIFGAAKLNLKIIDLPIRYRERTYGTTNISRWKHGLLLFRMVSFAARRIKFV